MKKIFSFSPFDFLMIVMVVSFLVTPLQSCAKNLMDNSENIAEMALIEDLNINKSLIAEENLQADNKQQDKRKKKEKNKPKTMKSDKTAVPESVWGANGIIFNVEENGVAIQYECAEGKIEQSLKIDKQGNFTTDGVHIRQRGGPIRVDAKPNRQPAIFEGNISGGIMTLKVTLTESKEVIGEYKLERGKTPRMRRCY